MANDFPRLLTLLRKERGESQKKAALSLGVSQALLSHYEKGIRECGLDFLTRCADYYGVSTDYLLGRDSNRNNAPAPDAAEKPAAGDENSFFSLQKKQLSNSFELLSEIFSHSNCRKLAVGADKYMRIVLYKLFRYYYSSNPDNQSSFFAVPEQLYPELTSSALMMCELTVKAEAAALRAKSGETACPAVSYDSISERSPQKATELFTMFKKVETSLLSLLASDN